MVQRMVAPLLAVEQERAILEQIVGPAGNRVEPRIVSHASIENVNHTLREFRTCFTSAATASTRGKSNR
jgi:hypothetical protein